MDIMNCKWFGATFDILKVGQQEIPTLSHETEVKPINIKLLLYFPDLHSFFNPCSHMQNQHSSRACTPTEYPGASSERLDKRSRGVIALP
jgi:hypothetical protein